MDLIRRALQSNTCVKNLVVQCYFTYGFRADFQDLIKGFERRVDFMETRSNYHSKEEIDRAVENLRFLRLFRDCMSSR
jgi:hypothetical protein